MKIEEKIILNDIAINVWKNKYKVNDDKKPSDTMKRIRHEFRKTIMSESTKWKSENIDDLSRRGQEVYRKIKYNRRTQFLTDCIDFDKIIPGGSAIYGIGNIESNSSISNCFVIDSPHDSLEGINYRINEMSILEKARGGVGLNISSIRPKGSRVNNQSKTSTGIVTFMNDFSQNNNIVAQDGRRGALMLCLDVNHPDIIDFITAKEDLSKITGANISVLITDEFMQLVNDDELLVTKFPTNSNFYPTKTDIKKAKIGELYYNEKKNTYWKIYKAKEVWDTIIHLAWKVAEPGVLFKDNWYKYGTDGVYDQYRPVATNPCSEIAMQPYDSCRLSSYNFMDCVLNPYTDKSSIDWNHLYDMCYNQMFLTDMMINIEIHHIKNIIKKNEDDTTTPDILKRPVINIYEKILKNTIDGRRCGCGFVGLGDMMAALGMKFINITPGTNTWEILHKIFETKRNAEIDCSIDLSILYGEPFKGFDYKKDSSQLFFKDDCVEMHLLLKRMKKYGRRNVSFSTAAPTGSISILAGTTSGIEPMFLPYYKRRVKIDNTERTDYTYQDVDGNKFVEYNVVHPGLVEWYSVSQNIPYKDAWKKMENMSDDELKSLYDISPYFGECANDISKECRINLQSLVQKYTTHSISSTLNLPATATEEDISEIYKISWQRGLKGNTVYRDGCRSGVIVSKTQEPSTKERPIEIPGILHRISYRKQDYGIIIGFINNKPYEVFVLSNLNALFLGSKCTDIKGIIVKNGSGDYDFIENDEDCDNKMPIEIMDLDKSEDKEQKFISLAISLMMRRGESIDEIVKIITKSEPVAGTFAYRLNKVLYQYKETQDEDTCPNCGSILTHENGCVICKECGWSKC